MNLGSELKTIEELKKINQSLETLNKLLATIAKSISNQNNK